jgi:hypothetical protein
MNRYPPARKSLDVAWVLGGIGERLPQLVYGHAQTVFEVDERVARPDLLP